MKKIIKITAIVFSVLLLTINLSFSKTNTVSKNNSSDVKAKSYLCMYWPKYWCNNGVTWDDYRPYKPPPTTINSYFLIER